MSHQQDFGVDPVLAHQQPASQPLFDFMETIAGRDLRHLKSLDENVPIPYQAQFRRRPESVAQNRGFHPYATSGNLHYRAVGPRLSPTARGVPTIPSLPTIATSTLLPSLVRTTTEAIPSFRK